MMVIGLFLGILLSIATSIAMWKYAHLFLSRRDYYVNSEFSLFMKRVSMSLSAGIVVYILMVFLTSGMYKKDKQQKVIVNKSDTLTFGKKVIKQAVKPKRKTEKTITKDTGDFQASNGEE